MAAAPTTATRSTSPAAGVLLVVAWLVPLGVLVQAVLAGQAWFVSPDLFGLHGGIGHGVLTLSVVGTVLAWYVRLSSLAAGLFTLSVVALIGQTGLGYAGHRTGIALASSLHVPLGVTILGLTVGAAVLLTVRSRERP